jgi:hypothetical protein
MKPNGAFEASAVLKKKRLRRDALSARENQTTRSAFTDLCEIRGWGCLANFTREEGPFRARGGLDGPIHSSQAFRTAASKLRMHDVLEGMCELLHAQA